MKDINTVNKLLKAYGHNETLHYDKWSEKHKYRALNNGHLKQWISNIVPSELLERTLKKAIESIDITINNINKEPIECTLVDLRKAYFYLGEITGNSANEDIIDNIFNKFCLGK